MRAAAQLPPGTARVSEMIGRRPRWFFLQLHREFRFTIDGAASRENSQLPRCWTPEDDALQQDWHSERVYLNPPYGQIGSFLGKAKAEALKGAVVVALVPVRADTAWWHDHAIHADQIRWIRGRLQFGERRNAPFASCVLVFGSGAEL